ncbi:unnamed protein product [Schistosoma haematobium]|nr:unnamed protein product [Schistosoma haematobium]
MLKGYLKGVVDLVNNLTEPAGSDENLTSGDTPEVLGEGFKDQDNGSSNRLRTLNSVPNSQSVDNSESSSVLSWIGSLIAANGENSMFYVDSLASMEINPNDDNEKQTDQESEKSLVITEDISKIEVPEVSKSQEDNKLITHNINCDWTDKFSVKTSHVWEQIKKDFNEVVHSVSEPKDVVYRTAFSVRDRITAAANTVKNLNPNEFLLPDNESETDQQFTKKGNIVDDDLTALPPALPSFTNIKQDVSQLVDSLYNGIMSTGTYFGLLTGENQCKDKSKHQTRLDLLRADPATYELEPPMPPASSGIHSYHDWRSAYFDEDNCQPMNGVLLANAKSHEYSNVPIEELTQAPHPSPEELLDSYPFMRTYLTQLVHPDRKINDKSMSDADFWSRYYYRVWLLDSTEFHRRRLNERVEFVSTVKQTIPNEPTRYANDTNETCKNLNVTQDDEWPDSDDHTTVENESEISNDEFITKYCNNDTTITSTRSDSQCSSRSFNQNNSIEKKIRRNSDSSSSNNNDNEKSNHESKSRRKHSYRKPLNKSKHLRKLSCNKKENLSDSLKPDNIKVECSSTLPTEDQNPTNVLSDFEEMTSGLSSVVILADEMENDEMTTAKAFTTDKSTVHSSERSTIEYKASIPDDEAWSDSENERKNYSLDKTNKKSTETNNNKDEAVTIKNSELQLTDEIDDWENWS